MAGLFGYDIETTLVKTKHILVGLQSLISPFISPHPHTTLTTIGLFHHLSSIF